MMIRRRREDEPVLNGINLYHKDDPSSKGAVTRIGNLWFWTRYSRHLDRWIIKLEWKRLFTDVKSGLGFARGSANMRKH